MNQTNKKYIMKTKWMIVNMLTFALLLIESTVNAQTVMVGEEQMYPKKILLKMLSIQRCIQHSWLQ